MGSTIRTNLKKYIVNRNMLSELYVIEIDCHIPKNSLRNVKFSMYIKQIFVKYCFCTAN